MFDKELMAKAEEILSIGRDRHLRIAAAESCTGGLIAALLTEIPVVERHRTQFCYLFKPRQARGSGRGRGFAETAWRGQRAGGACHGANTST